ncbi:MAG TPA: hypothetical protein PLV51_08225 [Lentimicrobium sp.]|nr:hypothetical protein [Lentimicrobium sp.]
MADAQIRIIIRKLSGSVPFPSSGSFYRINRERQESKPLFRVGMNYQAGKYTFRRSSFGQGFRYPAIAEKYAATAVRH